VPGERGLRQLRWRERSERFGHREAAPPPTGFNLNAHPETDLLTIVLTLGILMERFQPPAWTGARAVAC
jgi:hypothetical protein